MEQRDIKWIEQGYEGGAYILAYYVDGVKQCEMKGYPDYQKECFWVYPHRLSPFGNGKFPLCRYVVFREVKKGI